MSETLSYDTHEAWFHAFLTARTTGPRMKRVAELPKRLSGGWRSTVERAATLARAEGQATVATRLDSRLSSADAVADDGTTHKNYTCTDCGHVGDIDDFGTRTMDRRVKLDDDGTPRVLPHWTVVSVGAPSGGKVNVRISVRQNACRACRATRKPGGVVGTEAERDAYWARRGGAK